MSQELQAFAHATHLGNSLPILTLLIRVISLACFALAFSSWQHELSIFLYSACRMTSLRRARSDGSTLLLPTTRRRLSSFR